MLSARGQSKVFDEPVDRLIHVTRQEVNMFESVIPTPGVDLNGLLGRTFKVHEMILSDCCNGSMDSHSRLLSPLEFGRPIDSRPSNMPQTGLEVIGWL